MLIFGLIFGLVCGLVFPTLGVFVVGMTLGWALHARLSAWWHDPAVQAAFDKACER